MLIPGVPFCGRRDMQRSTLRSGFVTPAESVQGSGPEPGYRLLSYTVACRVSQFQIITLITQYIADSDGREVPINEDDARGVFFY